jgi:predicted nucleic acid-binding protein
MRVPNLQHSLGKLIAATAFLYDLTVVSRNVEDFKSTGVKLLNPFNPLVNQ